MSKFPYHIVDLTHTLRPNIPTWDGSCGFETFIDHDYDPNAICQFRTHKLNFKKAGVGTHMDAPVHCVPGGATIDEIPLSDLIAPCVLIDVSEFSHENYSVSLKDIETYETNYGAIESGSFVMIRTGWEEFWQTPEKYRNNLVYPFIGAEAAELLLKRNVVGVGIDTLSPDRPEDNFPVHRLFLGAGKYIVENAANLASLPASGSFIMALPIKLEGGSEAPIRLIGLIKKEAFQANLEKYKIQHQL